jgi:hypothetical protein
MRSGRRVSGRPTYGERPHTADAVIRLFAESRSGALVFRVSEKQVRWAAALADRPTDRRHMHGYNSATPGESTSRHWRGSFCEAHGTSWEMVDGPGGRWVRIEPCEHRPLRTSRGAIVN